MISPFESNLKDLQSSQVLCIFNFFAARKKKSCNIFLRELVARAGQREHSFPKTCSVWRGLCCLRNKINIDRAIEGASE